MTLYNPPSSSYGSSSYNAGGTGYYSGSNPILYPGYVDDVQLLIRLGQAALVVFIVVAVIAALFMLITLCMYCLGGSGGGAAPRASTPQPYMAPTAEKKRKVGSDYGNEGNSERF